MRIQEVKYGKRVTTDQELDRLRATSCLCITCERLTTDSDKENCPMAGVIFSLCRNVGMAVAVSRCAEYKERRLP